MKYLSIAAVLCAVSLSATSSQACSCIEPMPPKTEMAKMHAVFTGKVTKVDKAGDTSLQVTLEVASTWKGVAKKEVVVRTENDSAACGFNFEVGKSYLVYAYATGEEGAKDRPLATNICMRTRVLDDRAKPEVAELGPPEKKMLEP